jgi:hypothetical protein
LLLVVLVTFSVSAQNQEFTLQGITFRKNATQRLAKVLVANAKNNAIVTTDELGLFRIRCALGDTLLFRQKDYADQKVLVTNQIDLMIYLVPVINLTEVEIKDASKKQQLAGVMKEYNSHGIYNSGHNTLLGAAGSPLNALYNVLGSGPKQARRFQKYSKVELEQSEVDRKFTRKLIKQIIDIKDEKIQLFIDNYRPSYEDVKHWNDYDMINYIKKSFKDFEGNGDRPPRMQKLVPDSIRPTFKH